MTKKIIFTILCVFCITTAFSQEKTFSFSGKPIVTIFGNYHAGLGHANKESGFELDRSYLGYQFSVTKELSGKVVFDIGTSKVEGSDLERIAYVKNAMLTWQTGNFSLDFGLIGLEQFNIQEKFWGYRYIWKSFQDEYKFNSSADMGILAKYKFNSWLSADLSFINGEGYKKLNKDNRYRYSAGITINPVKSLTLRAYYDLYNGKGGDEKNQQSLALFAGYKHEKFYAGIEYNNLFNTKFQDDKNQTGYSAYASVDVYKKIALFGRYDNLTSKDDWNSGDQQRALIGVQYSPNKYLQISPNFQTVNPRTGKSSSYIYLNVGFKI